MLAGGSCNRCLITWSVDLLAGERKPIYVIAPHVAGTIWKSNGAAVQLIVDSSYYEMKITPNVCIDKLFCDPPSYKPKKGPRYWSYITRPPPSKKNWSPTRLCGMSRTEYPETNLKGTTLQKNTNTVSGLQLLG